MKPKPVSNIEATRMALRLMQQILTNLEERLNASHQRRNGRGAHGGSKPGASSAGEGTPLRGLRKKRQRVASGRMGYKPHGNKNPHHGPNSAPKKPAKKKGAGRKRTDSGSSSVHQGSSGGDGRGSIEVQQHPFGVHPEHSPTPFVSESSGAEQGLWPNAIWSAEKEVSEDPTIV
jgi:hypothetical protein